MDKMAEISSCTSSWPMIKSARHCPVVGRINDLGHRDNRSSCSSDLVLDLEVFNLLLDKLDDFFMAHSSIRVLRMILQDF